MCIKLSTFIGSLFILSNRPYIGLLNSIVAGLGSPAPTGVAHICNKAGLIILISINALLNCVLNKFYACFYLTIALVVVGGCYRLLNVCLPAKLLKCF